MTGSLHQRRLHQIAAVLAAVAMLVSQALLPAAQAASSSRAGCGGIAEAEAGCCCCPQAAGVTDCYQAPGDAGEDDDSRSLPCRDSGVCPCCAVAVTSTPMALISVTSSVNTEQRSHALLAVLSERPREDWHDLLLRPPINRT